MWFQSTEKYSKIKTMKYTCFLLSLRKTKGNLVEGNMQVFHTASNF